MAILAGFNNGFDIRSGCNGSALGTESHGIRGSGLGHGNTDQAREGWHDVGRHNESEV